MGPMRARPTLRSLVVGLGILAAAIGGAVAETGNCLSVTMPSSFALPGGTVHAPGNLVLCVARAFSPVASLHEVWLDGIPFGFLRSRRGVSEDPGPSQPTVTFRRDDNGLLHLIGYAWPSGSQTRTYLLDTESSNRGSPPATAVAAAAR